MSESVCFRAFNHILKVISGKKEGIIGLGSGSTVAPLAALLRNLPEGFKVVPTSRQSLQLILQHCAERLMPLEALTGPILITVDGADAVDLGRKLIVKGGGGCQVQEKIVAEASKAYCVVINDSSKLHSR
jgi:ribose 5-phosphate isomerase A